MTSSDPAPQASDDTAFFGHPKGLGYLVAAEACWAFAYYGMVSILTLYMTRQLFTPGHMEHIIGFPAYRRTIQAMFGAMTPLALASQTFGLITGFIYVTPIIGGLLADRWIGQRLAIVLGFGCLALGMALLVSEATFLIALVLLVIAGGLVKSNFLGQVGRLYGPDDPRRTPAYGWFLIAVNVGGFITPLVVGTLGEKVGWSQGFMAATVGAGLGFVAYLVGLRHMPADALVGPAAPRVEQATPGRANLFIILALLLVLVANLLNTGTYNQAFNIFPVWAKSHVDLNLFGFDMPVTWFSALDGVLTIVGTAAAVRFWAWQAKRGPEPVETSRIAIGCALTAIAFAVLSLGALAAQGGKTALVAPVLFFVLADAAIPWVDTVIMALFSRAAPAGTATTLLGCYYLAAAGGNFLVGWLGRFYEMMSPTAFWGLHAMIAAVAVVFILGLGAWLNRMIDGAPAAKA